MRAPPGLDVTKPLATNINVVNRNIRRPPQRFGRLWDWSQGFHNMGQEPQPDAETNENNKN